jgi:uncharacterized protein YecE (DUF72 family)
MMSRQRDHDPRIGCSGWNYKAWSGSFYPRTLPPARWLEFYAERFDTVEINNTFYRLPERSTFEGWRARLPKHFLAAIKASRFLTHMKRLRDPVEPVDRLFSRADALAQRLGPVLYQLPGNFTCDLSRLETFLKALPKRLRGMRLYHVMEFRHPSWYVKDTFDLLEEQHVSLCLHDKLGSKIVEPPVGPLVYLRFHGTSGHYHGSYGRRELTAWAHRLAEYAQEGRKVFAYFNNDPGASAVRNALTLRNAVQRLM